MEGWMNFAKQWNVDGYEIMSRQQLESIFTASSVPLPAPRPKNYALKPNKPQKSISIPKPK